MPDFLATVTDRSGKRETQTVHTDNSQQAVEFLQSHGCTAIVLHTDDTAAAAEAPLARMYPELTSQSSPQHRLEARGLTDLQFLLFTARVFYSKTPWMTIGLVAMLVINAVTGLHNALIYAFAGLGLLLPVFFAVLITLFGVARKYNRLAEALAWGRWQEVVDRSNRLKGRIPDSELARMRACALAGMGKLDEARAEWSKFENCADIPRWMYLAQLADILSYGRQYEESLECQAQALQQDPGNPTLKLDYAMGLLNAEQDTDFARQLISEAKQQHLSDLLVMTLPWIEGLLALNSADFGLAIERFEVARKNLLPLAGGEPLIGSMIDTIQAYLAIALAKSGQKRRAVAEAVAPRVRLEARNSSRLLNKLNDAVESRVQ